MTHPHEALADYAEGTADERERALVEAHLATCDECRSDLGSARAGLAAVRRLPELEAPSIAASLDLDQAATVVADPEDTASPDGEDASAGRWRAGPRTARHRVVPGRDPKVGRPTGEARRPGRWGAAAAGLAVAAAAAAIFVGAVRGGGGTGAETAANDSVAGGPAPRASLIESEHDYSSDELAALATQFVSRATAEPGSTVVTNPAEAAPTPPPSPVPPGTTAVPGALHTSPSAQLTSDPRSCVDQGSGVTSDLPLLYLEAARYEGKDAYIAVYQTQSSSGKPAVLVVAVGRSDCLPLYFGRQTG